MVTNPYLNNFFASNEQQLFDKLAVEFVQFYGIDCIYLPRTVTREDKMMHEDSLATFTEAKTLEMYIKETEGFQGDGDFLSKFGLQIRDSMTLSVAITRCKEELGPNRRPMEGDLIYLPLNKKMFEVVFVELPLEDAATPMISEELEGDGFGFAGVAPLFSSHGDLLRLIYLVEPLAREPIKTFDEFGGRLVDYALAEQTRVRTSL